MRFIYSQNCCVILPDVIGTLHGEACHLRLNDHQVEDETMNGELYPKVYLYKRIVQSKLFIDENFAENIDLECIADQAYFSKFHFIRLFKKIYGKTPHQYLSSVRIEKAKQLLKENTSVTEVCFAVGFDSVTSFTGLLKRAVGRTPLAYQLQQHRLKAETSKVPLKFIPNCFAGRNASPKNSNFEEAEY